MLLWVCVSGKLMCVCVCVCTLTLCAESECRSDMEQASGERADERACNTHNMLVPARTRGEARMRDQDGERATRFVLVLLMSKAEVKLDAKYYSLPTVSSIFINNLCGARCLRTIAWNNVQTQNKHVWIAHILVMRGDRTRDTTRPSLLAWWSTPIGYSCIC